MLMVIFGAGASFDSATGPVARDDGCPPQAKDLFTNRRVFNQAVAKFGACRPLVGELRALSEQENPPVLEEALAEMTKRADRNMETKRQLLALRFYLREAIEKHTEGWLQDVTFTNYGRLLRRIGDWRDETGEPVALVTFNYDVMLDLALIDQVAEGDFLSEPARYVSRRDWILCKLHGSTNWWRQLPTADPGVAFENAALAISRAHELELRGGEVIRAGVPDGPWHPTHEDGRAILYIPALAVPTTGKSTFETHPTHVQAFDRAAAEVDRLLIIGWRGIEEHAHDKLKAINPHYLLGIADPYPESVYNRLESAVNFDLGDGRTNNVANRSVRRFSWGSFKELLAGNDLDEWLRFPLPTQSRFDTQLVPWRERPDYDRVA